MAQCVQLELSGDGSYRVVPASSPDLNSCAYVIQSGAEVGNSLADFSSAQALEISSHIAALWGFAWAIKQIVIFLKGSSNEIE